MYLPIYLTFHPIFHKINILVLAFYKEKKAIMAFFLCNLEVQECIHFL